VKYEQITGRSLHDAMARAKTLLGDDIILMESKAVSPDDPNYNEDCTIRITVGVEIKEEAIQKKVMDAYKWHVNEAGGAQVPEVSPEKLAFQPILQANLRKEPAYPVEQQHQHHQQDQQLQPGLEPKHEIKQLRRKIDGLYNLLSTVIQPGLQGNYVSAYETLITRGVDKKDALEFTARVQGRFPDYKSASEIDIRQAIQSDFYPFTPRDRVSEMLRGEGQRILAFVGSPGVGKTTTIMKIALHDAMVPPESVGILSLDVYGIGAGKALEAFSRLTGVAVETVSDRAALPELMQRWYKKQVILVDTAGRSPNFPNYIRDLSRMFSILQPSNTYIVFDMRSDLEDMFLSGGRFSELRPSGIIATKFDETERPGKVISLSKGLELPVVFATAGQDVTGKSEPVKLNLFAE